MDMRYRRVGKTGWEISEVSLGTYPLGGALQTSGSYWSGPATYGAVSLDTAVKTIHAGLGAGLNFIDTAPVYGEAEKYISTALKKAPGKAGARRVYVGTKCGEHVRPVPGGGPPELARDFSRRALEESVNKSRDRLGVDKIDVVLLHSPNDNELVEHPLGLLVELRDRGVIAYVGESARNVDRALHLVEKDGRADFVQIAFNLLDPKPTRGLLQRAGERGVGILVRSPLASGFLTGELTAEHQFKPDDHRSTMTRESIRKQAGQANSFAWLVEEKIASSMSEAALRYILSFPEISAVIPGAMNEVEMLANLAISDRGPLPVEALRRIKAGQEALGL